MTVDITWRNHWGMEGSLCGLRDSDVVKIDVKHISLDDYKPEVYITINNYVIRDLRLRVEVTTDFVEFWQHRLDLPAENAVGNSTRVWQFKALDMGIPTEVLVRMKNHVKSLFAREYPGTP